MAATNIWAALPAKPPLRSRAEDQQVGGATSRMCHVLQTLPETQLAGTAWSSCL